VNILIDIKVKTKQREYDFQDVKSWIVDGLFLTVEAKNGDKRFIKTDDIEDILVKNVED
jgi:hypothetical protein